MTKKWGTRAGKRKFAPRSALMVASALLVVACSLSPSLLDYPAKTDDEARILRVISEFESAANSYDAPRLYSLYDPEATIQTSTQQGSLTWSIMNRHEWLPVIKRRIQESYVGTGLAFRLAAPKALEVAGNAARLMVPYTLSSAAIGYAENGFFNFELRKKDSRWAISKFRYEILYSSHPTFGEYLEWVKKQK